MNVTPLQLVEWAWELPDSRILGALQWVASTHFDVPRDVEPGVSRLEVIANGIASEPQIVFVEDADRSR